MADNTPAGYNQKSAREVQLAFKKATEGLSAAEEAELAELSARRQLRQAGFSS